MKIKEKYKNIKQNFANLGTTMKNDVKGIKTNTKIIFSTLWKDKVDVAMLALSIIFAVLDLVTPWDLTGFIGLMAAFVLGSLMRKAIWKYKYMTKDE